LQGLLYDGTHLHSFSMGFTNENFANRFSGEWYSGGSVYPTQSTPGTH
jgi:hypothetical protein